MIYGSVCSGIEAEALIIARDRLAKSGNPITGLPWGDVPEKAIRSGQWDLGEFIRRDLIGGAGDE